MPAQAFATYRPIAQQLRRWRRIRLIICCMLLMAAVTILLDHAGCFAYPGNDWRHFDRKSVLVVGVVEPVTVDIRTDSGKVARVHLLGTDASTTTANAAAYTATYLLNRHVVVRLDPIQTRDTNGYLLAYLYITDSIAFNVQIVHDGFAYSDRRVNHLLRAPMDAAETDARSHGRGLWKNVTESQMPAWRQQWLKDLRAHHHSGE